MKDKAAFDSFSALDIRAGTIIRVEESKTSKPTWRMTIDLGPELGSRVSCGAYTNYEASDLEGIQVICIVNLGTMKMGPEKSEELVVGVSDGSGGTIPLTTEKSVRNGESVF
ncbi:protein secretion chaperonin CsaA [Pantoea sp. Pa-EAmG]|uniref:protein secretion chaperonin CsaA n=1 Tax=Pantoea sp. Pa-EAmG TaxID=3043311 RepID=UPI0024AEAE8E|nr:protein secretion chaperonin CsaA [Pantoea sp. Pa-EAmG]MDI6958022.1 protein secretion chaperonin CsaA [Pantoea sp. Pa-EAmG]